MRLTDAIVLFTRNLAEAGATGHVAVILDGTVFEAVVEEANGVLRDADAPAPDPKVENWVRFHGGPLPLTIERARIVVDGMPPTEEQELAS